MISGQQLLFVSSNMTCVSLNMCPRWMCRSPEEWLKFMINDVTPSSPVIACRDGRSEVASLSCLVQPLEPWMFT